MAESDSKSGAPGEDEAGSPAFRVIDRRRFASDGSERDETPATEAAPTAAPRPSEDAPSASGARSSPGSRAAAARPEAGETASPPPAPGGVARGEDFLMAESPSGAGSSPDEANIGTLFLSLSTQALMHLGEIPDLATGESARDLRTARTIIDLLAVLEQKTKGNLDASEAVLLERILFDLRMRFVEISRTEC